MQILQQRPDTETRYIHSLSFLGSILQMQPNLQVLTLSLLQHRQHNFPLLPQANSDNLVTDQLPYFHAYNPNMRITHTIYKISENKIGLPTSLYTPHVQSLTYSRLPVYEVVAHQTCDPQDAILRQLLF